MLDSSNVMMTSLFDCSGKASPVDFQLLPPPLPCIKDTNIKETNNDRRITVTDIYIYICNCKNLKRDSLLATSLIGSIAVGTRYSRSLRPQLPAPVNHTDHIGCNLINEEPLEEPTFI